MNDHIYWTFSAAAQSISAFVAFLLTGYALVHNLMEAARVRDDSLEEVHETLRMTYHKRLNQLAWLTGSAIVLSLLVVFVNREDYTIYAFWLILVGAIDLLSIVFGLVFVVSIVDPRKYKKAAEQALDESKGSAKDRQSQTPASEFFDAFIHLEMLVRNVIAENKIIIRDSVPVRMYYSFRQMIEALYHNELIDRAFFDELIEISRYRNLIFHGHMTDADSVMVARVRKATERITSLERQAR